MAIDDFHVLFNRFKDEKLEFQELILDDQDN
jgi:hypothetical protein